MRKTLKKLFIPLLLLTMLAALCACGQGDTTTGKLDTTTGTSETPTGTNETPRKAPPTPSVSPQAILRMYIATANGRPLPKRAAPKSARKSASAHAATSRSRPYP